MTSEPCSSLTNRPFQPIQPVDVSKLLVAKLQPLKSELVAVMAILIHKQKHTTKVKKAGVQKVEGRSGNQGGSFVGNEGLLYNLDSSCTIFLPSNLLSYKSIGGPRQEFWKKHRESNHRGKVELFLLRKVAPEKTDTPPEV